MTHWLLYVTLRTRSDDILLCTIVTLLATVTASSHWLARPHVFSMPLTLIWYYLLDRFQYDGKPTLIYLPTIMLLWVNLHGGFILGIVLLSIYLAGNLVYSFSAESNARAPPSRQRQSLMLNHSLDDCRWRRQPVWCRNILVSVSGHLGSIYYGLGH